MIEKEFWIARDENKYLAGYNNKPKIVENDIELGYFEDESDCNIMVLDTALFPEITWENSPVKAKIIIEL
jgi:hypothetical protein